MILLWGLAEDPCLSEVRRALASREIAYLFVDQRGDVPRYSMRFGASVSGNILGYDLDIFSAAYLRPYDVNGLPEHANSFCRVVGHQRFARALTAWLEVGEINVVNRMSAQESNLSKLYQLHLIRGFGFDVPESLATTSPKAVADFAQRQGSVVYKSLSSVRSIVSRLGEEQKARIDDVRNCPTLFQGYVGGTDYRVHVVGDQVFATMIVSDGDDYRYDPETDQVPVTLPPELERRCVLLCRNLGLCLGGIDLRRTMEGRWVCFEVNPSPGFPCFDVGHRPSILDALIEVLAPPRNGGDEAESAKPMTLISRGS
jgi:hypothetical protein